MSSAISKIVSKDEAAELLARARRHNECVVFANGCFDLIHVGHIRYLHGARQEGDRLLVAINSDDSVRAIKGAGRPLVSGKDRAEIIASMECVDWVLLFDELTVDQLLSDLKPDVHAKGTDYTVETVPERETVRAYGGRVAIVGDPKAHSTAGLVQRVLDVSKC